MPATPDQIPTDLTLEIGENLSPERFIATARAFFGYVQELSHMVAPEGEQLHWIVKVREGSALLAVDASPGAPQEITQLVYASAERGIRHLINRDIEDSGLPEAALR